MKWVAILACLLLAGCAAMLVDIGARVPASQIPASPKGELRHAMKPCGELAAERDAIYTDLVAQSRAYDKGANSVSAAKIADLKGMHNMITSTMASKGCPGA